MAATGYTPIQLYYSTTASAAPTAGNLSNGELAINITDGKLYYKDNTGTVKVIAGAGGAGVAGGSNTQVQYNSSGSLAGSANMTFDGTTLTVNGLATTGTVTVGDASGDALTINSSAVSIPNGLNFDSNTFVIDATNNYVGIGTSSPRSQLDVYKATTGGNIRITSNTDAAYGELIFSSSNATYAAYGASISSLGDGGGVDSGNLMFNTGQGSVRATKMTLTGTGNLGLGVTPSGWGSGGNIDLGSSATVGSSNTVINIGANWYYNSGYKYKGTGAATQYQQNSGSHVWFTAASGTAGNAITFTQAMTLDASGNLGIGTTSPAFRTDIINNATYQLRLATTTSNYASGGVYFGASGTSDPYYYGYVRWDQGVLGLRIGAQNGSGGNGIVFETNGGATSPTERMRIDSSGNVGIGLTPSTTQGPKLQVSGSILALNTAGLNQIVFNSAGSNWGLITNPTNDTWGLGYTTSATPGTTLGTSALIWNASGNVGINTSTPTTKLDVAGSSSLAAFRTPNILEISTVSATAATGTINYDVTTQSVVYYTSNASGNFTLNFRGSSGTSLNTIMNTGDTVTVTFLCTNGSTAYYNSAVTIDGSSVTPKWQGGSAPTSGNVSSVDAYTYAIVKTGSATFTVLATQTKFA